METVARDLSEVESTAAISAVRGKVDVAIARPSIAPKTQPSAGADSVTRRRAAPDAGRATMGAHPLESPRHGFFEEGELDDVAVGDLLLASFGGVKGGIGSREAIVLRGVVADTLDALEFIIDRIDGTTDDESLSGAALRHAVRAHNRLRHAAAVSRRFAEVDAKGRAE